MIKRTNRIPFLWPTLALILCGIAISGCFLDSKKEQSGVPSNLPNLEIYPDEYNVRSGDQIEIKFADGWGVNEKAPTQFFLKLDGRTLFTWSRDDLKKTGKLTLPEMKEHGRYVLEGTVFYCAKNTPSRCLIKSVRLSLNGVKADSVPVLIDIQAI